MATDCDTAVRKTTATTPISSKCLYITPLMDVE